MDVPSRDEHGRHKGAHVPQIHFEPSAGPVRVGLISRGRLGERKRQYSLPDEPWARQGLTVEVCMLDAVFQAQAGVRAGHMGCAWSDPPRDTFWPNGLFRRPTNRPSAPSSQGSAGGAHGGQLSRLGPLASGKEHSLVQDRRAGRHPRATSSPWAIHAGRRGGTGSSSTTWGG